MPLQVRLFNTYSRNVELFEPIDESTVGVYCCGPTVYGYQHIGNFKTFLFEDLLVRTLRFAGYKVKHVMNITDVGHLTGDDDDGEDKMLVAMRRESKKSFEIAQYYTDKFFIDWDKLNLARPDIVCKATDHIDDMIQLIQKIEKNGYAYFANGNVYFDVEKFKNYGKLAKLDLEKLKAGARIGVDPHKRSPHDFVLWFTNSKFENQELQWDSPWGRGYPGWHIECSAMSMKYLGEQFDIHCGGIDHIPIHHTNEIAQSEAATGKPWVNMWMHSEFILINSEKMSKSTGKILVLDDLIEAGFSPEVYRLFCLSAGYRSQLNFSFQALESSKRTLQKLKNAIIELKTAVNGEPNANLDQTSQGHLDEFTRAICNDLNSAAALAVLWKVIGDEQIPKEQKLNLLYQYDLVLGLGFSEWKVERQEIPENIKKLADARYQARADKNWGEADRLRDELSKSGYKVVDEADGYSIERL